MIAGFIIKENWISVVDICVSDPMDVKVDVG